MVEPRLRFRRDDGSNYPNWSEHSIADLFDKVTTKNKDGANSNVITNSAEYGLIPQRDFFDKDIAVAGKTENYTVIDKGDFVYNPRKSSSAPMGPFNCYSYEERGIVSPLYSCLRPKGIANNDFLLWYFKTDKWFNYVETHGAQGGARHDRVGMTDKILMGIPVKVPCHEEQQKIADFLSSVDNVISSCEKELDQIKELKSGMLQKMFPKKGETAPEIRFPGFTGDWEQRKLESLCEVFTDGDWIEAKDQSDSGIRLVQTGNVGTTEYLDKENNKRWISEDTFERLHCEEIYEGDILISRLPEPAGRACIMPNIGTRMITAVDCTIVRTSKEYDSKYLVQYLSTPMYFKVVNSFLGGGTRQRISRGNLSGIDIPIPLTIEEQREIGEFFSNLDTLITLHQRELDKWKELKKGLLQQMFV